MKKLMAVLVVLFCLCTVLLIVCGIYFHKKSHLHDWRAWEVVREASCGTEGEKARSCAACSARETKVLAATGQHDFLDDTCRTCAVSRFTEGLVYQAIESGEGYLVSGIGTALDTYIVIRPTYQGKPVVGIGEAAFSGCGQLVGVEIPASVTQIGQSAFAFCHSLDKIEIPDSVLAIGMDAFAYCESLFSVHVASDNPVYHSAGNCLIETESKTLIRGCKSSVIPADGSVTVIGYGAFRGCRGLVHLTIPATVTAIGARAFYGCGDLAEVTFAQNGAWRVFDDELLNETVEVASTDRTQGASLLRSFYVYCQWQRI